MVVLKRGFVATHVFHLICIEDSYLNKKWNYNGFQSMPKCHFSLPPAVPQHPLMVKNQNRQITSKSVPFESARKTKQFLYKNLGLEMSRSKDMSTLIWSRDPKTTRIWYNNDNIFKTTYHKHT